MSKKKRTKKYTGWDARGDDSTVTVRKVSAVNRSPINQWVYEHRKLLKTVAIIALVGGGIAFLVVQGISHI